MKNITKNLMSITLGTALLVGSLGFSSTIEASPHNNTVYMDAGEQQPPEPPHQRYHSHKHHEQPQPPQQWPEQPPQDDNGPEQPPMMP